MATPWVKQHKKAMVLTILAVLLICTVAVYARVSVWGYNEDVYWDVTVENLYRSGNYTYSSHQYYIENDREVTVSLIDYEFKHRVIQTFPDGSGKVDQERISKKEPNGAVTVNIPKKSSARREFTHQVDIRGLPLGMYYIHAYTRINLADVDENPVPEAHMNTKSDQFRIM